MAAGEFEGFLRKIFAKVDDGVVKIATALRALATCPVVVN
jgi:hypothetical protein